MLVTYAVMFGDSITAGAAASDAAHCWVTLVGDSRGYSGYQNSGIGSTLLQNSLQNSVTTIGGAAANNGRDTYISRVTAYLPTHVYILYGLNDLRLKDTGITVASFQDSLEEIVEGIITAAGTPASQIVIGSPPYMDPAFYAGYSPFNGGSTLKHQSYVAAAAAVATSKGTHYVDVYQAMLDNGAGTLISADGVHPNDSGHRVIANAFLGAM